VQPSATDYFATDSRPIILFDGALCARRSAAAAHVLAQKRCHVAHSANGSAARLTALLLTLPRHAR
jgi:hypothetical protein